MSILDIFRRKPKEEKWIMAHPQLPELLKFVDTTVRQRNAQLEARVLELEKQLQKVSKKEQKKAQKQQEKTVQEVVEEYLRQKGEYEKTKNIIVLKLDVDKKKFPTFQTASKKFFGKFKKLYGIQLEETPNGQILFSPVLTDGKTDKLEPKHVKKVNEYVTDLRDIFYDECGIVSQLKSNVVSRYDITENNELVVIPRIEFSEDSNNNENKNNSSDPSDNSKNQNQNQKEPPLNDIERHHYETIIGELQSKLDNTSSELSRALKRERMLMQKIRDLEMAEELERYDADVSRAKTIAVLEKIKGMMVEHGKLLLANQDAEVNRVLTQRLNENLISTIDDLDHRIAELYGKTPREATKEELITEFDDIARIAKQHLGKEERVIEKEVEKEKPGPEVSPAPKKKSLLGKLTG